MKPSVGAVIRILLFAFLSIALHVQANKRSWSTEKARSHANYKPIGRGLPDISEEDKKAIADFKKLAKPAKTVNALGSNNMYYPWIPTVSDLNAAIPF
ncbi:hypothetical protein BBBOND_0305860 [Babesia bigemina]|uniref:Uncharacterized protein n=1 Tax=Babesia bigemina TaxID=5866 RepID=A0A061D9M4_BABBI|nr:hypothetical protein BBBOND_0305860 [Babesia bigemina]CDR96682.1 hypothetical protein BBBOND_0305860 [Babesia bigemina]|eukprot:XP_012768868.1 hypothetical protein BBBOND_0305860 [Babesia bigemina]